MGGEITMKITYDSKNDLLYIRLDTRKQQLENVRVKENIVLDIGEDDKLVGIEILDASRTLDLSQILPATVETF